MTVRKITTKKTSATKTAKKIFFTLLTLAILSMPATQNTYAYGGNGAPGFPPPLQVQLVCTYETKELPFDRTIQVPKCHMEHYQTNNGQTKQANKFENRLGNFLSRLINGK